MVIFVLAEIWKENKEMSSFSKKMNILSSERKMSKVIGRKKLRVGVRYTDRVLAPHTVLLAQVSSWLFPIYVVWKSYL